MVSKFALLLISGCQRTSKPKTIRVDLSKERSGRDSTRFLAVVGNWSIIDDGGTIRLVVRRKVTRSVPEEGYGLVKVRPRGEKRRLRDFDAASLVRHALRGRK